MESDSIFDLAKSVDAKAYPERRYGLSFKHNKARCPFHNDHDPSFSFYPKTKTFTCFGACSWNDGKDTGDVISLVAKREGISNLEAARQICDADE